MGEHGKERDSKGGTGEKSAGNTEETGGGVAEMYNIYK